MHGSAPSAAASCSASANPHLTICSASKHHHCSYYLTSGSKFGAEYLVYPGDPFLFHAQFTGHLVDESEVLRPCLLAGTARGSHSARKHLLFLIKGKVS